MCSSNLMFPIGVSTNSPFFNTFRASFAAAFMSSSVSGFSNFVPDSHVLALGIFISANVGSFGLLRITSLSPRISQFGVLATMSLTRSSGILSSETSVSSASSKSGISSTGSSLGSKPSPMASSRSTSSTPIPLPKSYGG